jgi:hypothetical protein
MPIRQDVGYLAHAKIKAAKGDTHKKRRRCMGK